MAMSMRDICKRSTAAKEIKNSIKELSQRQIVQRLRENKLSTRDLTSELADRLIRFEIYRCIPEANVFWNDAEDVASDLDNWRQKKSMEMSKLYSQSTMKNWGFRKL